MHIGWKQLPGLDGNEWNYFLSSGKYDSSYTYCGRKLIGGVKKSTYYLISPGMTDMNPLIRDGVKKWRDSGVVSYTTTTSVASSTNLRFDSLYSSSATPGFCYYHDANGTIINSGGYPTRDYGYARCWLNSRLLLQYSETTSETIIAHEMGHAFGLMHGKRSRYDVMTYHTAKLLNRNPTYAERVAIDSIY